MKLYFKKAQEGMPEEYEPVLIHLERKESEQEVEWAVGYYNGSKWFFDVPREVFDHVERYTGHEIPSGEDVVELGFRRVTHWAKLPDSPEWNLIRASDVPVIDPPAVRYNRAEDLVEIFGGSSAYTQENPYYLEKERFATTSAALKSMAHLAGKRWATEAFMHRLAAVLDEALSASSGRSAQPKPN
jgi:Protein of unknown function (DUF551)